MLVGLYIFVDDDFDDPLYAEPKGRELEDEVWEGMCEAANDAIEGDSDAQGTVEVGEVIVGWRHLVKPGLSFVCAVTEDVKPSLVNKFLRALARQYLDEVDDLRHPDRAGIKDVIVDVIPPWEEEED